LFFLQGLQNLLGGDGKGVKPYADGIVDGIDDGWGWGQLGSLPGFLRTERSLGVIRLDFYGYDGRDFESRWQTVIEKGWVRFLYPLPPVY